MGTDGGNTTVEVFIVIQCDPCNERRDTCYDIDFILQKIQQSIPKFFRYLSQDVKFILDNRFESVIIGHFTENPGSTNM